MRRLFIVGFALPAAILFAQILFAQEVGLLESSVLLGQGAAPLRFEVVSIRVAAPITSRGEIVGGRSGGPGSTSPERISWRYVPMGSLMETAYGTRRRRIVGPEWLWLFNPATVFDIQASVPPGVTNAQVGAMVRSMLEERFAVKVHQEMQQRDVYILTAKPGTELKSDVQLDPSSNQYNLIQSGKMGLMSGAKDGGMLVAGNTTVQQLAEMLEYDLDESAIIVDRTGLTGTYPIAIHYSNGKRGSDDPKWPTLVRALQDLGLKVERKKEPVEVLVVDHVEKAPTEN